MSKIIGIDLDTTNSAATYMTDEGPRLIPNALGELLTPSVIGVDEEGKLLVGRAARELQPELSFGFDRFELLLEASAGLRDLDRREAVPRWFLRLIAASWTRPFAEIRLRVVELLETVAGAPRRWLDHLDAIQARGPTTLAVVGELLDQFEQSQGKTLAGPPDPAVLSRMVKVLLASMQEGSYAEERPQFLAFCLREAVGIEEVAEVARDFVGDWEEAGADWAKALTADWPLRYVCRACRLFWA